MLKLLDQRIGHRMPIAAPGLEPDYNHYRSSYYERSVYNMKKIQIVRFLV